MEHLGISLIFILAGIAIVTIVDAIGSILSRKMNFNYGYFTIVSIVAYTYIAYLVSVEINSWLMTMFIVLIIGFYDGTVGWIISQKLGANYGKAKEFAEKMTFAHTILAGLIFSILCGLLGIYLAS